MDPNIVTPNQPPTPQAPASKTKLWTWVGIAAAVLVVAAALFLVFTSEDAKAPTNTSTNSSDSKSEQQQAPKSDEEIANAIDPCALLSESDRAKFKLAEGEEEKTRLTNGCDWDVPLESPSDPNSLYIHVSVYPRYTMSQVGEFMRDEGSQPLTVGAHEGLLIAAPESSATAGVCTVSMAIGPNKKATVRISANGTLVEPISHAAKVEKYCGIAKELAQSVEAKLPK